MKYQGNFEDVFELIKSEFDFDTLDFTQMNVYSGSIINQYNCSWALDEYMKGIYEGVNFEPETKYKVWEKVTDGCGFTFRKIIYVEPYIYNNEANESFNIANEKLAKAKEDYNVEYRKYNTPKH